MSTVTAASDTETTTRQHGALAGTVTLLGFILRRDRIRFPAWVLGMAALAGYFANALGTIIDPDDLEGMAALAANPIVGLIGGPGYGFDDLTVARFLAGLYAVYLMLGVALMSITTISRHTRVEEQTGRAELVRAYVVGRHAHLTAALVVAVAMNVLVSVLVGLVVVSSAIEPQPEAAGSILFAASVGAAGLAFAGVTAITVQLSPFSRVGSGIAGAVLGVAFVVRGLGDMSAIQDGDLDWLSWLSPLGWSQQTAPFTLDRWWPLTLSVSAAVVLTLVGYALQSRRDLAAGIMPDRLGAPGAPAWLRSSLALAFRLQRTSLIWWSVAMLLAGVTFGAFVETMRDGAEAMPEELTAMMGGADTIVEGYIGFMGVYFAIFMAVFGVLSVQSLRGEEQALRAEPVLATPVSRANWMLAWISITACGAIWLLLLAGAGSGVGAAGTVGDWELFWPTTLGHVAHTPTVWLLVGLAVVLYGVSSRLVGLAWIPLAYSTVLSLFGPMMDFDQEVLDTSVFEHVGQHPLEDISWGAVGVLTAAAVLLTLIGVAAFRRRDLTST